MFNKRGSLHCALLATLIVAAGCDRIEGQAKDLASSSSEAANAAVRGAKNALVSDMQLKSEQLCIAQFDGKTMRPESSGSECFDMVGTFDPETYAKNELRVSVQGDGKYLMRFGAFRRMTADLPWSCRGLTDNNEETHVVGQYEAVCSVENGVLKWAKLYAPGKGPLF